MKKNFFKKLAFVLAFALVITSIAPVGTKASAATKAPTLNTTGKVILLNGDATYDFNIKNKPAKVTAKWSSSNKSIATVNASGLVTAKKIGKVIISAKVGTKTLKATVVVKENAETVTITNVPTAAVKIGEKVDLNRKYTTVTGGKTTDITKWEVTDANGNATITSAGIFTATAAGKYTVVASTYQSKTATVATATSAPVTITVQNSIASFKAVSSTKFNVAFDSAVTSTALADYTLTNVATSSKVVLKAATLAADKKSIVLESYSALVSGQTYKLTAKVDSTDMSAELAFVKGSVAKIVGSNQLVLKNTASKVTYTVYDENGLDITDDTSVSFESTAGTFPSSGKILLGDGVVSYVTVVYNNYTTGAEVRSNQFTVTGSASIPSTFDSYTIAATQSAVWSSPSSSIAKGATGKYIHVRITDQYGVTKTATNGTDVKFESLDPSVIVVDSLTGELTTVAVGTGYIKIISASDSTVYKVVPVTVKAASYAASIAVTYVGNGSLTGVTATNNAGATIKVLDQYGDSYAPAGGNSFTITCTSGLGVLGEFTSAVPSQSYSGKGTGDTWFSFTPAKAGTAYLRINSGSLAAKYFQIVVTSANNTETGYTLDGVKDLNVEEAYTPSYTDGDASTTLKIYTSNSNGEKVNLITGANLTADKIVVTAPDGSTTKTVSGSDLSTGFSLNVKDSFINHTTGTYSVVAYVNGIAIATKTFTVTDTGAAPSVVLNSNTLTGNCTLSDIDGLLTYDRADYVLTDATFISSNQSGTDAIASHTIGNAWGDTYGQATLYGIKIQLKRLTAGEDGSYRYYTISLTNASVVVSY
jgi:Bacterial Ig-like domain (group 2).